MAGHHVELETKRQFMEWKHSWTTKNAMDVSSAGNVMTAVLWDTKYIVTTIYLQKGRNINVEYYANLLKFFSKGYLEQRLMKVVFFIKTMLQYTRPWLQWLQWFDYYLFSNIKIRTWLWTYITVMMTSYLTLLNFLTKRMNSLHWIVRC